MSSKFFSNKHDNQINGSRGPQNKKSPNSSNRTNEKRMNKTIKKSGRGR